jgi:hypothetical protein
LRGFGLFGSFQRGFSGKAVVDVVDEGEEIFLTPWIRLIFILNQSIGRPLVDFYYCCVEAIQKIYNNRFYVSMS